MKSVLLITLLAAVAALAQQPPTKPAPTKATGGILMHLVQRDV